MKQQKNRYARVNDQIMRMRRLYSQIGEPLPADVIIDLCGHLDKTLELANSSKKSIPNKKTICRKLH